MTPAVRKLQDAARDALRRLRPLGHEEALAPVLPPQRAYELWAATYDTPPTALQGLEHRARTRLPIEPKGARIVDLGCGTGRVGRELLDRGAASVVGLDFAGPMLARARMAGDGDSGTDDDGARAAPGALGWVAGEVARLPFAPGAFDGAVCSLVLGHLPVLAPALAEMSRVVHAGGWVVVSEFHPQASARGWSRTFVDVASGRTYRIEQTPHPVDAYRAGLEAEGFTVRALAEEAYRGTPVVFALLAHRNGDG